jgi:predicted SAM-dependent methyltransferase
MKKLHLGCGKEIKKGYINIDKVKLKGVDMVYDLNKFPYPFENNEVDEIFCKHFLEHVEDFMKVVDELYRICKPNAKIRVIVPYFAGFGAYHPTHRYFFTYKSFECFKKKYYSKAILKTLKRKIFFFSSKGFMKSKFYSLPVDFLINLFPVFYQRFFCWILPASEVHFLLEVKK